MSNTECLECVGCSDYYCTWCEEVKVCDSCGESFCENCLDDFKECGGCKKKYCSQCVEDFSICAQTKECIFTACEECMKNHEHEECDDLEEKENP